MLNYILAPINAIFVCIKLLLAKIAFLNCVLQRGCVAGQKCGFLCFQVPLKQDIANFLLLSMLYMLQGETVPFHLSYTLKHSISRVSPLFLRFVHAGVPFGLVSGSLPFLLKSRTTYSEIGVLSLATWPYSLKCLWSPVVDAVFSPRFGSLLLFVRFARCFVSCDFSHLCAVFDVLIVL